MEQFRKVNYTQDWSTAIYNYLNNKLKSILKKFNLDNFKIIKVNKSLSYISLEDTNTGLRVYFYWHSYFWPFNITFPYYYDKDILDRQYSNDTSLPYNLTWAQQYATLDEELGLKWKEYYIYNN